MERLDMQSPTMCPALPCFESRPRLTQLIHLDDVTESPHASSVMNELRRTAGGVISIGNFDGVHRGHAGLLLQLKRLAEIDQTPAVAVTFDPHPAAILRPDQVPPPLTDMVTRADRMSQFGIDALVVCQTTPDLLNLEADSFYQSLVRDRLDASGMVEGPNFFFGRGRRGSVDELTRWCHRDGLTFQVARQTDDGGEMISSSRIRERIASGDMKAAADMMGAPHRLIGTVVHGDARGRTIGFPTANLESIGVVIPPPGVYGGTVRLDSQTHLAAINIGPNPTFTDSPQMKVEVHVMDYAGDLYDQRLSVDVRTKVRDIARFDSADLLVEQLQKDIQTIRQSIQ